MCRLVALVLALPLLLLGADAAAQPGRAAPPPEADECSSGWLPTGHLFAPLRAEPLAPRFAGGLGYLESSERLISAGQGDFPYGLVALGGTLGVHRDGGCDGFQVSVAAGTVSIFELESWEGTLINSDFRVAIPLEFRRGLLSARVRLAHQSSHIGDEFLLRDDGFERDDISFEWLDGTVAVGDERWRLYAGGGAVLNSVEGPEGRIALAGLEVGGTSRGVHPTGAVHWESRAGQGWSGTFNAHAGVALVADERLELVATYLRGENPYGQFFDDEEVEMLGFELRGGL